MFLIDLTVENASGEIVWVTPIGAVGKEGKRRLLPLSACKIPYLPTPFRKEFPLAQGARRSFIYDWDDIQFSAPFGSRGRSRRLCLRREGAPGKNRCLFRVDISLRKPLTLRL